MKIFFCLAFFLVSISPAQSNGPNIVLFFVDDMGYGDMGVTGQTLFTTPNLDKMAADGMLFTDFYAGSTVCAPSRTSLMQGLHTGHSRIRANALATLLPEDVALGEILKYGEYNTGYVGKWGIGESAPADDPQKNGFDYFFGYINNWHAHNCFPPYLVYNADTVKLGNVLEARWDNKIGTVQYGTGVAETKVDFAPFWLRDSAVSYIKQKFNDPKPFFLFYSPPIPHANNEGGGNGMEVPDYGEFANENWPNSEKGFAQLMRYIDNDVGLFINLLDSLNISDKTLMIFTSDNGPHNEGGHNSNYFNSNGDLRGIKRDLYEGGIRVPMIAWWPGVVKAGEVTNHISMFPDFMTTFADLAGVAPPDNVDGISFVPTLFGTSPQAEHEYIYYEFGNKTSVRKGDWKYVVIGGTEYLYNLSQDIGETNDVKGQNAAILADLKNLAVQAHENNPVVVQWTPARVPPAQVPVVQKLSGSSTDANGYIKFHMLNSKKSNTGKIYSIDGKKVFKDYSAGIYMKKKSQLTKTEKK